MHRILFNLILTFLLFFIQLCPGQVLQEIDSNYADTSVNFHQDNNQQTDIEENEQKYLWVDSSDDYIYIGGKEGSETHFEIISNTSWRVYSTAGENVLILPREGENDEIITVKSLKEFACSCFILDTIIIEGSGVEPLVLFLNHSGVGTRVLFSNAEGGILTFEYFDGYTKTIDIESNTSWNLGSCEWLEFTPSGGEFNSTIQARVTRENTTDEIILSYINTHGRSYNPVLQFPSNPVVFVEAEPYLGNRKYNQDQFYIYSNGCWEITADADWIDFSPAQGCLNQQITVTTLFENPAEEVRTDTLVISGPGMEPANVTVKQLPKLVEAPPNVQDVEVCGGMDTILYVASSEISGHPRKMIKWYASDSELRFVDQRDGKWYTSTGIGNQIWMKENLDFGYVIQPGTNMYDNSIPEKYQGLSEGGGLYQWDEMMQYNPTSGSKGICPDGWHVPSNKDWMELEIALGMDSAEAIKTESWRELDEGVDLYLHGNLGFYAIGGKRLPNGKIDGNNYATYWSSDPYFTRTFNKKSEIFASNRFTMDYGFPVRCVKNSSDYLMSGNYYDPGNLAPGDYTFFVTQTPSGWGTESKKVPFHLTIHPLPEINLKDTVYVFTGDTVILDAGNEHESYSWNNGLTDPVQTIIPVEPGNSHFYVDVVNEYGCKSSDTVVVSVSPNENTNIVSTGDRISIFPNPARNSIRIQSEHYAGDILKIAIHNLSGNVYYFDELKTAGNSIDHEVDISGLAPGIYFLELGLEEEDIVFKFIKA